MDVHYSILTGVITTRFNPQDLDTIINEKVESDEEFERSVQPLVDPETDFHLLPQVHYPQESEFNWAYDPEDLEEIEGVNEQG
jgi:hypothetical protein